MSEITFGSVGDIVAVGQIALALAQALSSSRGSVKEYQGLVKELQKFDQALLQVIALWQNYEQSPELNELGTITREIVNDWKDILLAFRLKVSKKYGDSLSPAGSRNWLKDAKHKVEWLKEREDVLELRRKLHTASDTITMLILAAMGKSNRLAETAQAVRVELVHELLQESVKLAEKQLSRLKIIDEKLDAQVKSSDLILTTVKSGFSYLTQIVSITIDMKVVLSLLRSHILAQQTTPRGLGGHWQQAPVTLEDALGFIVPIPLEPVDSWEMFDMILLKRFEQHPGHRKVQRGEFAIEDDTTGRELSRQSAWSMCFRPGQKVDMSVLFSDIDAGGNHCPRCRTKSSASSDARVQCINSTCKMWFQRVVEVDKSDDHGEPTRSGPAQQEPTTPKPPGNPTDPTLRPGDFQRVKLMMKHINQRRREHEEYKKKRDPGPAFVPNSGAFFMHDQRHAGPATNGFRPFGRRRERPRSRGRPIENLADLQAAIKIIEQNREISPNSQALFSQLASGGATPTALNFHETAMHAADDAAAVQKRDAVQAQPNITFQPQEISNGMEVKPGRTPENLANAASRLSLVMPANELDFNETLSEAEQALHSEGWRVHWTTVTRAR